MLLIDADALDPADPRVPRPEASPEAGRGELQGRTGPLPG
jgi:hypothetical protein